MVAHDGIDIVDAAFEERLEKREARRRRKGMPADSLGGVGKDTVAKSARRKTEQAAANDIAELGEFVGTNLATQTAEMESLKSFIEKRSQLEGGERSQGEPDMSIERQQR